MCPISCGYLLARIQVIDKRMIILTANRRYSPGLLISLLARALNRRVLIIWMISRKENRVTYFANEDTSSKTCWMSCHVIEVIVRKRRTAQSHVTVVVVRSAMSRGISNISIHHPPEHVERVSLRVSFCFCEVYCHPGFPVMGKDDGTR